MITRIIAAGGNPPVWGNVAMAVNKVDGLSSPASSTYRQSGTRLGERGVIAIIKLLEEKASISV